MASFLNDFGGEAKKNLREDFREGFEQNTGVFGQALRERRMREERKKRTEKEVASIQEGIGKLRLTSNSLFNIERSFLQISRNVQLIAKAMDAQVTLQKESDKLTKQLTDISQTKQQTAKPKPKQQAAIEKIGDQKEEQSLLSKIGDLVDNFERKRRTGRTPQKRTPRGRANRLKRLSKVNLGRAAQVLGRVGTTAARFSPVASIAAYGYGAYKASEFLEKTSYGASMAHGAGQTAERAFRNKDTSYGTDLTPDQARAILEQPDSPAKQRDIKAFGGLEKIQAIANIQLKAEPKPETKPTLPVSSAGGGRGVVNPALVKPREERVQPTQVWVDSEGRPITTGTGETVQAAPAAQPVKPIPPPPPPALAAKPQVAATPTDIKTQTNGKFSNPKDFIAALLPYAQKVTDMIGGKVPPIAILGQWAGESGAGSSMPADFNYAGIKAGTQFTKGDFVLTEERYTDKQLERAKASGEELAAVLGPDDKMKKKGRSVTVDEWYGKGAWQAAKNEGKNWVQVKSYFAKFKDFNDFATSFAKFIMSPRYSKAREQTTPAGFGLEIAKAGYATASAEKYSAKIANFASSQGNDLGQMSTNVAAAKRDTSSTPNVTVIAVTNQQTIKKPAGMPARNEYPTPVAA